LSHLLVASKAPITGEHNIMAEDNASIGELAARWRLANNETREAPASDPDIPTDASSGPANLEKYLPNHPGKRPGELDPGDAAREALSSTAYYQKWLGRPDQSAWDVPAYDAQSRRDDVLGMSPNTAYSDAARANVGEGRGSLMDALAATRRYATGQDSMVAKQTEMERDAMQRQALSNMASMNRYNPAMARQIQSNLGNNLVELGSNAGLARAQEKASAMKSWTNLASGIRGQDMGQFGQEASQEQSMRNFLMQQQEMAKGYDVMGLQDKWNQSAAQQNLQQFLANRDLNFLRASMGLQGVDAQKNSSLGQTIGQGIGTAAGMGIGLAGLLSDIRAKKNIVPMGGATSEAPVAAPVAPMPDAGGFTAPYGPQGDTGTGMPIGGNPNFVAPTNMAQMPIQNAAINAAKKTEKDKPEGMSMKEKMMFAGILASSFGGLGKSIGGAIGLSDKRKKKQIKGGASFTENFLREIDATKGIKNAPTEVKRKYAQPTDNHTSMVDHIYKPSMIDARGMVANAPTEVARQYAQPTDNVASMISQVYKPSMIDARGQVANAPTEVAPAYAQPTANLFAGVPQPQPVPGVPQPQPVPGTRYAPPSAPAPGRYAPPSAPITLASAAPLGGSLIGSAPIALSDNRAKELEQENKGLKNQVQEMMANLKPYTYEYKDEIQQKYDVPAGKQLGVMAQDAEKSQAGAQMVSEDPETGLKVMDYSPNKFGPIALASLADLNTRISKLEK